MAEKTINSRIIHKHDIEANWSKTVNFIPQQGELIVYDIDENYDYERFKIGDGETLVSALPFTNDVIVNNTIDEICELSDELFNAGYREYVDDVVSVHNMASDSHNDIRKTISNLTTRLDALADSDDTALDQYATKEYLEQVVGDTMDAHITDQSNPHGVTASQIGLANVENKSSATIRSEITKTDVTNALGYTPPTADTTYREGAGILITNHTINNSGVRTIATGTTNGTISVNTNGTSTEVAIKGLGTAAYTASSDYAPASHSQAASTITAGTFSGQVIADSATQTYSTSLLRNSKLVSTDTNPTVNGEIYWTYE